MITKRGKLIVVALALLFAALAFSVFCTRRSGVNAYSTDKRVKIYEVRYLTGTNNTYSYLPPLKKAQLAFQRMLTKFGVRPATWWVTPITFQVPGGSLVFCGRFGRNDPDDVLELVSEGPASHPVKGGVILTYGGGVPMRIEGAEILILNPINSGTYRLRCRGQRNDLAIIRVR